MSALLVVPLLPAAAVSVAVALAAAIAVAAGVVAAAVLAVLCAALAIASADAARRVTWAGAACCAMLMAASVVVGGAPDVDVARLIALDALRAELAHALRTLVPAPESGILLGIVLGERASLSPHLVDAFAATGTSHLLAISGFNMTLVGGAVALLLRGRLAPPPRAAATVGAIATYSVLVGLSPSVLRAALMASVGALGLASGRRAATANALCAAVVAMLAADHTAMRDVGFLLSAAATAGLVLWQEPLADRLAPLPRIVRAGLATTIAASAPTLPIVAAVFGRVSLVSPLANVVAVPIFPPLMLAGAAAGAVGAFSPDAARPVALLAYACAFALRGVVEAFASLPVAAVSIPAGPLSGALVTALLVGAALVLPRVVSGATRAAPYARFRELRASFLSGAASRHALAPRTPLRLPTSAALLVPGLVLIGALVWPMADPEVRVRALDVGQGDAYLVELGGATMLIDGGPDPARLLDQLGASLPPWRRRIDVVALTHAHLDHGAGLLGALGSYEIGTTLEPAGLNAGALADLWSEAVARARAQRQVLRAGQSLRVGDAVITALSPEDDPRVDTPSLVLRIERGAFSAVFMGDATDDALADLLLRPEALRSRVYVPPHHGATTPHSRTLVDAVRPELALISVGAGNRYGHPTPDTLAALDAVPTFRTDRDGTVEVTFDGTGLVVRAHANGLPPPRRGSVPYAPARR